MENTVFPYPFLAPVRNGLTGIKKKKKKKWVFYSARRPIMSMHKTSFFFVTIIADSYCPEPQMGKHEERKGNGQLQLSRLSSSPAPQLPHHNISLTNLISPTLISSPNQALLCLIGRVCLIANRLMDPSSETTYAMLGIGVSESYPAQFLSSHALLQEQISRWLKTDAIPTEDGQLQQIKKKKGGRRGGMCMCVCVKIFGLRWRGHYILNDEKM